MTEKDTQDVTVVIKTLIRYKALFRTIRHFRKLLPHVPIVVIDDTPKDLLQTVDLPNVNHVVTKPDIGLCAGRNLGFQTADTEFVFYTDDDQIPLITDDLFLKAMNHLRSGKSDIVGSSGGIHRIGSDGTVMHEKVKGKYDYGSDGFIQVDQTANTFIARRQFVLDNPYNEKIKINGEHFSTFTRWRKAGGKVFALQGFGCKNRHTPNKAYRKFRRRWFKGVGLKDAGVKKFFYAKKVRHPADPEVLIISHPDHGTPWVDSLMDYNPKAVVHVAVNEDYSNSKRALMTQDAFIRNWWKAHGEQVKGKHLLVLSYDCDYRDRLPYLDWLKGVAGKCVVEKPKKWPWWKHGKHLPKEMKPVGLSPYTCVAFSREALDCIVDDKWDALYAKIIQGELRTSSVLRSCGFDVKSLALPDVTHNHNITRDIPGVYSRVLPNNEGHFAWTHDYLDELCTFLKSIGVNPFLCYGSALFAQRDGVLARHFDNDVDIGVKLDEWTDDVMKKVKNRYGNKYFGQGRFFGRTYIGKKRSRCVDIFPFGEHDGQYYTHVGGASFHKYPAHIFNNLADVDLNGYTFQIPDSIDEYLTLTYGDWRTEKRSFGTWWRKHKIKLNEADVGILRQEFKVPKEFKIRKSI